MVIEFYHIARNGTPKDLVNKNNDALVFPYASSCVSLIYLNTDEFIGERDTIADENNTEGNVYYSLFKLNDWVMISATLPEHTMKMLYMLKTISNKYIIRNNEKLRFYDIIVTENEKSDGAVGVTIQLLLEETTITGNY